MSLDQIKNAALCLKKEEESVMSLRRTVARQKAHIAQAVKALAETSDGSEKVRLSDQLVSMRSVLASEQAELDIAEKRLAVASQQFETAVTSYQKPPVSILQLWMWKVQTWLAVALQV